MKLKAFFFFIILILAVSFLYYQQPSQKETKIALPRKQETVSEIEQIKKLTNLDDQVVWYKQLIDRVGPENAQEELLKSNLPFDGQTHLLNHTVGVYLYQKEGAEGLSGCKDYFLSSCYHGFIIQAVADQGLDVLTSVMVSCQKGGEKVTVQCAHATGHGLLAREGYPNLVEALNYCDSVGTKVSNFPLYSCHDGVFMENIWAVHEDGSTSSLRWVRDNDPLYPCSDPRIEDKYLNACWSEQPTRLYQLYRGDLKKVGKICLEVKNQTWQKTCFDGLARQIHPLTKGQSEEVFRQCGLMPGGWVGACVSSIAKAAYSVGDRDLPYVLCSRLEGKDGEDCYNLLIAIIKSYYPDLDKRQTSCEKVPAGNLRDKCLS